MSDALKRLIEAVNADAFDRLDASARYNYFCNMWEACLGVATVSYEKGWAAYRKGDLNAAKSLHDALLPGWRWGVSYNDHTGMPYPFQTFWVQNPEGNSGTSFFKPIGTTNDPARSWLVAILRAKLAQTDQPNGLKSA